MNVLRVGVWWRGRESLFQAEGPRCVLRFDLNVLRVAVWWRGRESLFQAEGPKQSMIMEPFGFKDSGIVFLEAPVLDMEDSEH